MIIVTTAVDYSLILPYKIESFYHRNDVTVLLFILENDAQISMQSTENAPSQYATRLCRATSRVVSIQSET